MQNIRTSVLHPESSVQVLTGDLLVDRLLGKAHSVSEVLGVPVAEAEILCAAHDWDVHGLVSSYVRDAAKTRGDAGLSVVPGRASAASAASPSDLVTCIVCTDEVEPSAAFSLWCEHTFCNDCWSQHVRSQVCVCGVPAACHSAALLLPRGRSSCFDVCCVSAAGGGQGACAVHDVQVQCPRVLL